MNNSATLKVTTPTDREIVITRVFDAPRTLVWEAMSKPELLKRWLFGPPGWSMVVCEDDPRVGGAFRCAWRGPDGTEMAMRGVYREVVPPERACARSPSSSDATPRPASSWRRWYSRSKAAGRL
jgi:uncharacterized protein YndB with AHSA1/START domain